jgi:hypothetical protein
VRQRVAFRRSLEDKGWNDERRRHKDRHLEPFGDSPTQVVHGAVVRHFPGRVAVETTSRMRSAVQSG